MGSDEQAAFTALYRRYYAPVLRYAQRRVGDQQAREVAADTFLVAWRRLDAVPEEDAALPWLYAVARNTIGDELRRRRRYLNLTRRLQAAAAARALTVHPDHAERLAERDRIAAALNRLSPRDREAVQLVAWEELSVNDAATVAGCTVTAMKVRLHRARRRLGRLLAETTHPAQSPVPAPASDPVTSAAYPEGSQ